MAATGRSSGSSIRFLGYPPPHQPQPLHPVIPIMNHHYYTYSRFTRYPIIHIGDQGEREREREIMCILFSSEDDTENLARV